MQGGWNQGPPQGGNPPPPPGGYGPPPGAPPGGYGQPPGYPPGAPPGGYGQPPGYPPQGYGQPPPGMPNPYAPPMAGYPGMVPVEQGSIGLGFLAGFFGGCIGLILVMAIAKGPDTKKGAGIGFAVQVVLGSIARFALMASH